MPNSSGVYMRVRIGMETRVMACAIAFPLNRANTLRKKSFFKTLGSPIILTVCLIVRLSNNKEHQLA